jgi:hypothetical protein
MNKEFEIVKCFFKPRLKPEEMKKSRNENKSPKDKNPRNKKGQDKNREEKDEVFQPINTGLVTTDAEEWSGIEVNNENEIQNEMKHEPVKRINTGEDKEGREEADDELNTHEQNKITNKNKNIVNKPD